MAKEKKNDPKRCTVLARVSFPKVFQPIAYDDTKEKRYSCDVLVPKGSEEKPSKELLKMKKAVTAAIIEEYGEDKTKWPKGLRRPFNDGDKKEDCDGYAGMMYVIAKNKRKPIVIDQKRLPLTEESDEFYGGCYAVFALRAFHYGEKGSKVTPGVAFSLEAVQKHSNGERFGAGGIDIETTFSDIEDEDSEKEENYDDGESESGDDDDSGW